MPRENAGKTLLGRPVGNCTRAVLPAALAAGRRGRDKKYLTVGKRSGGGLVPSARRSGKWLRRLLAWTPRAPLPSGLLGPPAAYPRRGGAAIGLRCPDWTATSRVAKRSAAQVRTGWVNLTCPVGRQCRSKPLSEVSSCGTGTELPLLAWYCTPLQSSKHPIFKALRV